MGVGVADAVPKRWEAVTAAALKDRTVAPRFLRLPKPHGRSAVVGGYRQECAVQRHVLHQAAWTALAGVGARPAGRNGPFGTTVERPWFRRQILAAVCLDAQP